MNKSYVELYAERQRPRRTLLQYLRAKLRNWLGITELSQQLEGLQTWTHEQFLFQDEQNHQLTCSNPDPLDLASARASANRITSDAAGMKVGKPNGN